jgi:hypothetical protein
MKNRIESENKNAIILKKKKLQTGSFGIHSGRSSVFGGQSDIRIAEA